MRLLRTILATLQKESLLMVRDPGAWLLLLVMPAMLVIIMALVQDVPFRDYQTIRFEMLFADDDHSAFSREIRRGIETNAGFNLVDSVEGNEVTLSILQDGLKKGKQQVGVFIPKGCGAEIANSSNKIAN